MLRAETHRGHHVFFFRFVAFRFDHRGVCGRADDDEIEVAFVARLVRRVDHPFAADAADADTADRTGPRNVGHAERDRRADHRRHVVVVFFIERERRKDDLDFVADLLFEERADRAVDHAADDDGVIGRTAFAFHEARRLNLTRGVETLLVFDGQRQEVDAVARAGAHRGGYEHHGVAVAHDARAVGLLGDLADLNRERFAAPFKRELLGHSWLSDVSRIQYSVLRRRAGR